MSAILLLTLRQIASVRRLLIVGLLAALPLALTILATTLDELDGGSNGDVDDFIAVVIAGLVVGVVLPISSMALAAPAFGDDVEDRTLSFIALTPIPRWRIALAKFAAPIIIAAPVVAVSGLATAYVGLNGDVQASVAVFVALLLGAAAYCAIFALAGLMTTRAISLGIVYVFLWEGLASTLVPGVKYLSVSAYTVSVMLGLNEEGMATATLSEGAVGFPAALIGLAAVMGATYALSVWRLRTMDVG